MPTNLERYRKDLDRLVAFGAELSNALYFEWYPKEFKEQIRERYRRIFAKKEDSSDPPAQRSGKAADPKAVDAATQKLLGTLPSFSEKYQSWYSEAKALIRQLLPDRLSDFVRHYEKPKPRKDIDFESYRIEDCLQGLRVTRAGETKVDGSAAVPHFRQQLAILRSAADRFESSLFDIRQLVQADLLDSELDAARELDRHKFHRAAGAICGVVLEKHLAQVSENHAIRITKKNPTINDFNEALKAADVLDIPTWRRIQSLADTRNLCDHDKKKEPSQEQIDDLITGTEKITKTVF